VYSTILSAFTSTIISVQPGRTVYETSISTKEGPTLTATLHSVQTLTTATCSIPIGPVSAPSTLILTKTLPGETYTSIVSPSCTPHGPVKPPTTITLTHTLPGATFTSFYTAPGYNHSVVRTSVITRTISGPTIVQTAPGDRTTLTEYQTTTLPGLTFTAPGGKHTLTEYATETLPGSIITSIINHPGENSTITSTETTTCYETVSTCSATPVSPPHPETTIYATEYITKTLPTTYTAHETCSDATITVTASSKGWDEGGGYGDHSSSHAGGDWGGKHSGYGDAAASSTGGGWRRV
jgi:hypothetical protein